MEENESCFCTSHHDTILGGHGYNCESKTIGLLKENMGRYICDLGVGIDFFSLFPFFPFIYLYISGGTGLIFKSYIGNEQSNVYSDLNFCQVLSVLKLFHEVLVSKHCKFCNRHPHQSLFSSVEFNYCFSSIST